VLGASALRLTAVDEAQRERERRESERQLALARQTLVRMDEVLRKVRRMNELYRERLDGVRDRRR